MAAAPMEIRPLTLTGRHVDLVPLSPEHLGRAIEIGLAGDIFKWYPQWVRTPEEMRAFFAGIFEAQQAGTALPFSTFDRASGQLVGGTRYMNIDRANRRLEIGGTWIAQPWQRSHVNTEAKLLMLEHAFEKLGCIRVEFKTDSLNQASRAALLRIGAREEGTFRNHIITASGRIRHSVYFSIIAGEWPEVKAGLLEKLARGARQP